MSNATVSRRDNFTRRAWSVIELQAMHQQQSLADLVPLETTGIAISAAPGGVFRVTFEAIATPELLARFAPDLLPEKAC